MKFSVIAFTAAACVAMGVANAADVNTNSVPAVISPEKAFEAAQAVDLPDGIVLTGKTDAIEMPASIADKSSGDKTEEANMATTDAAVASHQEQWGYGGLGGYGAWGGLGGWGGWGGWGGFGPYRFGYSCGGLGGWAYPLGYWNAFGAGLWGGGCGLGLAYGGLFYC